MAKGITLHSSRVCAFVFRRLSPFLQLTDKETGATTTIPDQWSAYATKTIPPVGSSRLQAFDQVVDPVTHDLLDVIERAEALGIEPPAG